MLVNFNGPTRLGVDRDHEEESVDSGADRVCSSSIRSGYAGGGSDPQDGDFGADESEADLGRSSISSVEEAIRRPWGAGVATAEASRGGEQEAESAGGGLEPSKHWEEDVLPIHEELAAILRPWLATKAQDERTWAGP